MDFGWNKPAGQTQDDNSQTASNTDIGNAQTATPAATPTSSWDLPAEDGKQSNQNETPPKEKDDLDFSANKPDDSFSDNFTVDHPAKDNLPEDEPSETADGNADSVATVENEETEIPPIEDNEEKDEASSDQTETENTVEPVNEITEPAASSADNKSLTELENDILSQKDKVDKDIADLQAKTSKLDELLTKIKNMQNEERDLIQEISSAL